MILAGIAIMMQARKWIRKSADAVRSKRISFTFTAHIAGKHLFERSNMTLSGRIIEQRIGTGYMAEVVDRSITFMAQGAWRLTPNQARSKMESFIGVPIKWEAKLYDFRDNVLGTIEWKGAESCEIKKTV